MLEAKTMTLAKRRKKKKNQGREEKKSQGREGSSCQYKNYHTGSILSSIKPGF
jgi:hypothetical protein